MPKDKQKEQQEQTLLNAKPIQNRPTMRRTKLLEIQRHKQAQKPGMVNNRKHARRYLRGVKKLSVVATHGENPNRVIVQRHKEKDLVRKRGRESDRGTG
jgi:hypothetical protein